MASSFSYGFVEVQGVAAALSAVDVMCKSAQVEFVMWERKWGGRLVTVVLKGDISAGQEALCAAETHGLKKPVAMGAMANPHEQIIALVSKRKTHGADACT
jgi:microcompartment protein CcmL/EutN